MLLSIVIPTKDRYHSLYGTLVALNKLDLYDAEIVVQDNTFDNSEIIQKIGKLDIVRYYHEQGELSVSENSDLAIKHSAGEYVVFLGDDDAVTPEIIDVVKFMASNSIDACCVPYARFNWPELMEEAHLQYSVELLRDNHGDIEIIDSEKELFKMMRDASFSLRIPKVYQGIVSRKVLDLVFEKTGTFFPGPSPDMANGVAVALLSQKVIQINSPIIIAGFSKKSASGLGTMKKHVATIESVPWLKKDVLDNWDSRIPRIWTGETIWAESLIKSLESLNYSDYTKKYNYKRLYSKFTVSHPGLIKYVFKVKGTAKYSIIYDLPIYLFKKIVAKIAHKKHAQFVPLCKEQISIEKAISILQEYITDNPIGYSSYKN